MNQQKSKSYQLSISSEQAVALQTAHDLLKDAVQNSTHFKYEMIPQVYQTNNVLLSIVNSFMEAQQEEQEKEAEQKEKEQSAEDQKAKPDDYKPHPVERKMTAKEYQKHKNSPKT